MPRDFMKHLICNGRFSVNDDPTPPPPNKSGALRICKWTSKISDLVYKVTVLTNVLCGANRREGEKRTAQKEKDFSAVGPLYQYHVPLYITFMK